ncbi:unnamed protein product [Ascophyllum nodosum]
MSIPWSIVTGMVYGVLVSATTVAGLIACWKDPVDPNVHRFREGETSTGSAADKTFCFLCQLHVNKGSRHCRYCDKCVDRFDHHCKWLNNCIGRSNYRYFIALLISTFLMISMQIGLSVWFIWVFHTTKDSGARGLSHGPVKIAGDIHIVFVYIFAVLVLPFLGLLAQLLGFHVMLLSQDLTTYDYIVQEQRKDRERKERRRKLEKESGGKPTCLSCSSTTSMEVETDGTNSRLDNNMRGKTG